MVIWFRCIFLTLRLLVYSPKPRDSHCKSSASLGAPPMSQQGASVEPSNTMASTCPDVKQDLSQAPGSVFTALSPEAVSCLCYVLPFRYRSDTMLLHLKRAIPVHGTATTL